MGNVNGKPGEKHHTVETAAGMVLGLWISVVNGKPGVAAGETYKATADKYRLSLDDLFSEYTGKEMAETLSAGDAWVIYRVERASGRMS